MAFHWLTEDELNFPHPKHANGDGILAIGGDLSVDRLLLAYSWGIFPWYNEGEPIIWWHPDPRFVLFPHQLKVSKSMRPYFNQRKFEVSFDTAFEAVIAACQQTYRQGQGGQTWITAEMKNAYINLHQRGFAHSVEVWQSGELVGGLYGIALGKVFFGESMFTKVSNASKVGFISIVKKLEEEGFRLIDCQQETKHLKSLGANAISRDQFLKHLIDNQKEQTIVGSWKKWNK